MVVDGGKIERAREAGTGKVARTRKERPTTFGMSSESAASASMVSGANLAALAPCGIAAALANNPRLAEFFTNMPRLPLRAEARPEGEMS